MTKTKTMYLTIIACILLLSCNSNKVKNSLTEEKLKGDVTSVSEMITSSDDNNYFWHTISNYNGRGNLSERDIAESNAKNIHETFVYDDRGNCIEKQSSDRLDTKEYYKYDDDRNLIEERAYHDNDSNAGITRYKYDNRGDIVEVQHSYVYATGRMDDTSAPGTFKYDDRGNLISQANHVCKYDEQNNLIEEQDYRDGKPDSKFTYTYKYDNYDKEGNWLQRTKTTFNGQTITTKREISYSSSLRSAHDSGGGDSGNKMSWLMIIIGLAGLVFTILRIKSNLLKLGLSILFSLVIVCGVFSPKSITQAPQLIISGILNKKHSNANVKAGDWLMVGNYFSRYTHIDDTGGMWENEKTIDEWKVTPADYKEVNDTLINVHAYWYGKLYDRESVIWLSELNDTLCQITFFVGIDGTIHKDILGVRIKP